MGAHRRRSAERADGEEEEDDEDDVSGVLMATRWTDRRTRFSSGRKKRSLVTVLFLSTKLPLQSSGELSPADGGEEASHWFLHQRQLFGTFNNY